MAPELLSQLWTHNIRTTKNFWFPPEKNYEIY